MGKLAKYVYQIRSRNGVVVNNLQIQGASEEDARQKLMQMYPHCDILSCHSVVAGHHGGTSYEAVLDEIIKE